MVLCLCAAFCLLTGRLRFLGRLFVALSLLDLAAHAILEGAHWQMIPAYLAVAMLGFAAWKRGRAFSGFQAWACGAAMLLLAASVGLSWMLPMFRLPKPTGPYPVGTTILYFKDASRVEDASSTPGQPRELMVQLWYPAGATSNRLAGYRQARETSLSSSYQSAIATNSRRDAPVASMGAPFAVILFNHGWGGRRTNDTFLTEELASHGYVVASIDHTYNASLVAFPDGRQVHGNAAGEIGDPEGSTPEQVRAIWDKELAKQEADERFVLDRLEAMSQAAATPWSGKLNTHQAGAMGHSFGGSAATDICALDPRVRASINMDGWFFGAIRARGANQPLMFMDTSEDYVGTPPDPNAKVSAALDAADSADLLQSMRSYGGYVVTFQGAQHEDFTDQGLVSPLRRFSHSGRIPARQMETIVRAYVVAFFDQTLRGEHPGILNAKPGPYPQAVLESWSGNPGDSAERTSSKGQ